MGVIKRQGFKATIVAYAGTLLGALTTIFIYPYFLNPEMVGLTRIIIDSAIMFAFFSQFGLTNAIIKHFPMLKKKDERDQFIWFVIFIPLISFSLFCCIFFLFRNSISMIFTAKSELFAKYVIWILPLAFFMMYQFVFEAYASVYHRIAVPKVIREIVIRSLMIAAIVIFSIAHLDTKNFIELIILTYFAAAVLNIGYLVFVMKVKFPRIQLSLISGEFFRKMINFMMYMLLGGIGANVITRMDIFMLGYLSGLSKTGIYSIAFFIATIIEIPFRSAVQIIGPILSESLENGNIQKVDDIYKRNTLSQLIFGGVILILVWINVDNIFKIMPNGHLFAEGKYVVLFIGLSKIFDISTGLNNQIIIYSKYYKTALIWIISLGTLTIISNLILIPIMGINGAAISTLISIVLVNTIVIIFIKIKLKTQPFTFGCLLILLIIAGCYGANLLIPVFPNPWIDGLIRSAAIIIMYVNIVYWSRISKDINQLADKFLNYREMIKFIKG